MQECNQAKKISSGHLKIRSFNQSDKSMSNAQNKRKIENLINRYPSLFTCAEGKTKVIRQMENWRHM